MSLKDKVKNIFKDYSKEPLPPALKGKVFSYYAIGRFFVALSIVFGLMARSFKIMGFPLICGLSMIILGLSFAFSVRFSGYEIKRGRCIDQTNRLTTILGDKRKGADFFILETGDEVLRVPVSKRRAAPPLDSFVEVYVSKTASKYVRDGYAVYDTVYGYSVIAEGTVE